MYFSRPSALIGALSFLMLAAPITRPALAVQHEPIARPAAKVANVASVPARIVHTGRQTGFSISVLPGHGLGRYSRSTRFATAILPRMNGVRDLPMRSSLDSLSQYIRRITGAPPHNEIDLPGNPNDGPKIDGDTLPYLQPGYADVYPGMLVHGSTALLKAGQVVPLQVTGGPGSVSVNALFSKGSPSRSVPADSADNIANAMSQIMNQPFASDQLGQGANCAAHRIYSKADALWTINASASYLTASVSDSFSSASSSSSNKAMVYCTHDYFTAYYTPNAVNNLSLFSAYFNPTVTPNELGSALGGDGDVPMVVNSVTYGSQLIILFSSQQSASTMANDLNLAYSGVTASAQGDLKTKLSHDLSDSTCQVIGNGGRASAFVEATKAGCNGGNAIGALNAYVQGEADIASGKDQAQAVGVPIGYTLDYLDGFPATIYASVYGPQKDVSTQQLTSATVQFHQNGDGKDPDTTVDLYLIDATGKNVAKVSIPTNTPFADNGDSPTYTFKLINPNVPVLREDLDGGVFRMIIHPNGRDTWHYTAHLAFKYNNHTQDVGQADNTISQDNPERAQSLSDYIGSFNRTSLNILK